MFLSVFNSKTCALDRCDKQDDNKVIRLGFLSRYTYSKVSNLKKKNN